jgi:hypothetical protein
MPDVFEPRPPAGCLAIIVAVITAIAAAAILKGHQRP